MGARDGLRALAVLAGVALLACGGASPPAASRDVAVRVGSVGLDPRAGAPVVVLREEAGERFLPIWVGFAEASSIAAELAHEEPPRPNTHDLLLRVIEDLEGRVVSAVVTELRGATYFAVLNVDTRGARREIDARPSDAVAIALRAGAPLFVREPLFEAASETPAGGDAPQREAAVASPTDRLAAHAAPPSVPGLQRTGSSCAAPARIVSAGAVSVGDARDGG